MTAVFLGRLVPVKGVDVLLGALPPGLDLVIAGDGPCAGELRAQAAPHAAQVRFLGELRGRERDDLLAAADLVALPSRVLGDGRSEGAQGVLREAMAAGRAVIATRSGDAEDVLTDGDNGLLIPPDDRGALRAALVRLAADRPLRERLGGAARSSADRFGWDAVGPRLAAGWLALRTPLRTA